MDTKIDYERIVNNIDQMIFQLEYDSMRSGGKVKMNAEQLNDLYALKERYSKVVKVNNPTKKEG